MAKKRYPQSRATAAAEIPPDLARILCDLESLDEKTRASAVRQLCPCRGDCWDVPIFPRVLELRDDPSPIVRHAVLHDLEENPYWNERQEARRLEGQRVRREVQQVQEEIRAGAPEEELPAPHSMAWRMPRRPRVRKRYYPVT